MALATFVGPNGYGFHADQRPRAPRAPTGAENQARARVNRRDLLPRPPACVVVTDDQGNITPASEACLRKMGMLLAEPATRFKLPESFKSAAPPPPEVRAGAEGPDVLEDIAIALNSSTTGGGGGASATAFFNYPVLLESATYIRDGLSAAGDTDSAWIDYDNTAIVAFQAGVDDPIFTYAFGSTPADVRMPAAQGPFDPVIIPCHKLITKTPWRLAAAINSTPIGLVTSLWVFKLKVATRAMIQRGLPFAQPQPVILIQAATAPRPPNVINVQYNITQGAGVRQIGGGPAIAGPATVQQPLSTAAKIEWLANQLRTAPRLHASVEAAAMSLGIGPEGLVLARQAATRPANIGLLASILGRRELPQVTAFQPSQMGLVL